VVGNDRKQLIRVCLEILSGIRSNLSIEELVALGYKSSNGGDPKCDLYRFEDDRVWRGTLKPPEGVMGFDQAVREHPSTICSLAIDVLMRLMDEKPPEKRGRK
jgi:hypothetical protein